MALVLVVVLVPSHVNEATDPVDNLGGILSLVMVASLVLAINFAAVPDRGTVALGVAAIAVTVAIAFYIRQRTTRFPLFDLKVAGRSVFWVAACAGITCSAGASILPAAALMVVIAPRSAKWSRPAAPASRC